MFAPEMQYLGRVRRVVPYKDKRIQCPFVKEWMQATNIPFTEKYQMCLPNPLAMTASIKKYNRPQPLLDMVAWKLSGEWTLNHFRPYLQDSAILPLSKCIADADRQTSAGYPWSLWYKNKGEFLDSGASVDVLTAYWCSLATENPFTTLWTASLKQELRSKEKIVQNKIRTFTASACEHSISLNRMCLDFNERFYSSNNKTWSFVGCSKFNGGFDRLFRRLSKHPCAFELDESSFDASLFRLALEGQRDLRWELMSAYWKTADNRKRFWNLYRQVIHSCIVLDDGDVVQKHTGNPSGSANTIVDNTMILFRLFAYSWICLSRESPDRHVYSSYASFQAHVEAALNGDDNTFTVSQQCVGWFNARSVSRVWTSIGVETNTPEWDPRRLEDCDFLSQSFVKLHGKWLPKPERDKVLCSLLWGSTVSDVRWTLMRAYALRIESWADVVLRRDLMSFIKYVEKVHSSQLKGNILDSKGEVLMSMDNIKRVWKSDAEIQRLYCDAVPEVNPLQRVVNSFPPFVRRQFNEMGLLEGEHAKPIKIELQGCAMPAKSKKKGGSQVKNRQPKSRKAAKNRKPKPKGNGSGGERRYAAPVQMGMVRTTALAKRGPTTITHRESLGTVSATSTAFQIPMTLPVNPGQSNSFPWLSNIASQYETYRFRKIRYCWETRSATSNAGVVIMVTNYDASESAFTSTQQAENYRGATVGQPWISFCHDLNVGSMSDYNRHYVRPGSQVSGTDIKTYDVGNFYLILSGVSVTSLLGELYVEYVVDFFDPRVAVPIGQNLPMAHIAGAGAGTDAAPLTGAALRAGSNLPGLSFSTTTVTIPRPGRYMITETVTSAAITASPTSTLGGGATDVKILATDTVASTPGFVLNTCGLITHIFDVPAAGNGTVAFTAGTGVVAGKVDVVVVQLSSGLTKPMDEKEKKVDRALEYFKSFEDAVRASKGDLKDFKFGWDPDVSTLKVAKVSSREQEEYFHVDGKAETGESPKKDSVVKPKGAPTTTNSGRRVG